MTETRHDWPNSTGGTASFYFDDETRKITNIIQNLHPEGVFPFIKYIKNVTHLPLNEVTFVFNNFLDQKRDNDAELSQEAISPDIKNRYDKDQICIAWASRDTLRGQTMAEFIDDTLGSENGVLNRPISTFKKDLRGAFERGLITKDKKGRFIPIPK
jgi:hypothetical protein